MKKKPFNAKAHQGNTSSIQEEKKSKKKKQPKVILEGDVTLTKTDENNPLILPSKKVKKPKKKEVGPKPKPKKVLSKKKQKQLKLIMAKKEKSANTAALAETLKQLVPSADVRSKLLAVSTSNKGMKRFLEEDTNDQPAKKKKLNSIKGASRKRRKNMLPQIREPEPSMPEERDPNIIGLEPTPLEDILSSEEEEDGGIEIDEGTTATEKELSKKVNEELAEEEEIELKDAESSEEDNKENEGENGEEVKDEQNEDESGEEPEDEEDESEEEVEDEEDESEEEVEDESNKEAKENEVDNRSQEATAAEKPQEEEVAPLQINPNYVPVSRTPEVEEARRKLPILGMEQEIMETINDNPIVIICGETGSGKTTQVPQFLYEAGYARNGKLIGITEPRRVAANSMSHRVSEEMSLSQKEVSYLMRYEGTLSPETKILFMTDGVLMKMVEKDAFLEQFSAIIIDEAHERSIHTDILVGILSRVVHLKNRTEDHVKKLIIMSATLNVNDLISNPKLFSVTPPVINVESRQYPVTNHFSRFTPRDTEYLDQAYAKICKIHRTLPDGGILVFVTGKNEITYLMKKLRTTFPSRAKKSKQNAPEEPKPEEIEKPQSPPPKLPSKISLNDYSVLPVEDDVDLHGFNDILENEDDRRMTKQLMKSSQKPLYVLPLYAKLPPNHQKLVFKPPPEGSRLCVVATNVAETSITIPNIKYVVDTGKVKQRLYDKVSGISKFQIIWISKASAEQRSGRAGRTTEGHCYRLYSSAVYQNEFPQQAPPEICLKPLDDLVLQLKNLNIKNVGAFPFPTRPTTESLNAAAERLVKLKAIDPPQSETEKNCWLGSITRMGEKMAQLPITPRFALILIQARMDPELLSHLIALVSAISTDELFLNPDEANSEEELSNWKKIKRSWTKDEVSKKLGDLTLYLKAVVAAEQAQMSAAFARKHGLRLKALKEIRQTRIQISKQMKKEFPNLEIPSELELKMPSDKVLDTIRMLIHRSSLPYDQVAHLVPSGKKGAYECLQLPGKAVYIHPNSVLHKNPLAIYVAYQEMVESTHIYMKGVSIVDTAWIPQEARRNNYDNCTCARPLEEPPPRYCPKEDYVLCHASVTVGTWKFPPVEIQHPEESERYRWFGYHFLNGDVFPSMKEFLEHLVLPPNTMVMSWAHLKPHCNALYEDLQKEEIDTKKKLTKKWKKDCTYLRKTFEFWIKDDPSKLLFGKWPPK